MTSVTFNLEFFSVTAMAQDLAPNARRLLELSLELHNDFKIALSNTSGDARSPPVVPHLIESILFSRRFAPQYLVVLVIAVLSVSLFKCFYRCISRRTRTRVDHQDVSVPSIASSSSSTLRGAESPPLKRYDESESTPLLGQVYGISEELLSGPRRTWLYARYLLLRQPRSIPSLTGPKNTLPANETSVVILLFLALNLFYLLYRMPLSKEYIFALADRAGLVFVVNLPVLYILAAKNNYILGWLTGWSYEGLNIFHRRLGEWMTVVAIVHAVGMLIGFYQLLAPFGYTLGWYLTRRIIILGVIAFYSYLALYFTSLAGFRQRMYEVFLSLHIALQILALGTVFFHHHDARPYVGAALGIWVLDRGMSRIACKTRAVIVTLDIAKDDETVLVHCDIPVRRSWVPRAGIESGWHAGQHVFLTVPEMGIKHRFQAHPFTIATPAPPEGLTKGNWPLQLTIRAQDGFSRELLHYAKHHQHTRAYMDGPYSSNEVLKAVTESDRLCLIAGGSGIAVTYPFAWSRLAGTTKKHEIIHERPRYVQGKKVSKPNVLKSSALLDPMEFVHIWVRQEDCHESWITMLPSARRSPADQSEPQEAVDLVTHRYNTRSTTGSERPDVKTELEAWVRGDLKQKIDKCDRVCVVVSGPDGLVRDVRNAGALMVREGWNVEVYVEKFGW